MVDIEKIRAKATEKGMSITELEKAAGVANGIIGKWSNSSPNLDSLQKVAGVLDCKIEYFLKEED